MIATGWEVRLLHAFWIERFNTITRSLIPIIISFNQLAEGYYYQEASQQRGLEAKQRELLINSHVTRCTYHVTQVSFAESLSAGCLLQIQSPSKNITICMQAGIVNNNPA